MILRVAAPNVKAQAQPLELRVNCNCDVQIS
jgi:hypothetical protein